MHDAHMNPAIAATTRPSPAPAARLSAVAGAVAAGVAIGLSELVGGVLAGTSSLVAAIGQQVIDRQPPGAKDLVVALFGTNDKLALEVVVVLVVLAFGAGLGLLARRSFVAAALGFAAFGVLGFLAALGDPTANASLVAAQVAVAVVAGVQTLSWSMGQIHGVAASPATLGPDPVRRSFLVRTGALGIAAVVAGLSGRALLERSRVAPVGDASPIPTAAQPVAPLVNGVDLAPTTPGLTPIVMPNDQFYRIDTALITPSVDLMTWRLRVHGLVNREVSLSWDDLIAMPMLEQYVTIACVSNEVGGDLVGNAKWSGVRLRDVLELAGVQASATQLVGRSVDGWTAGMPTAWVMDEAREPMIAIKMNDEPLPPAHGFPARLIVPGLYGYVSATKWLSDLELTTLESFNGYWVPLGWSKEAPILTQSRIDTPHGSVATGRVAIAGIAWAPDRGVSKVEVAVDGEWRDAQLSVPISETTWVQWVVAWEATPGEHTIAVRATDGEGLVQEELSSPPAPDGARGWHTIRVNVG